MTTLDNADSVKLTDEEHNILISLLDRSIKELPRSKKMMGGIWRAEHIALRDKLEGQTGERTPQV